MTRFLGEGHREWSPTRPGEARKQRGVIEDTRRITTFDSTTNLSVESGQPQA
jgi:hypothetical protein